MTLELIFFLISYIFRFVIRNKFHNLLQRIFHNSLKRARECLLHKDLKIVRDMAAQAGIRATVIEQSLADYAELMALGFGDEDTSALIRLKKARIAAS